MAERLLTKARGKALSTALRSGLAIGLVCGGLGCASAGGPPEVEPATSTSGLIKQERTIRSIAGLTRVERWRSPGEEEARMIKVERYVSGMALVKGVRLIFHGELRRWMLSLDEHLLSLDSLQGERPYPELPSGMQGPVVWQGAYEYGGHHWQLAIFNRHIPQTVPGIATEAEASLDLLMWR